MVCKSVAVPLSRHFAWPIHPSFAALSGWLSSAKRNLLFFIEFCKNYLLYSTPHLAYSLPFSTYPPLISTSKMNV
jgi:hypothetical protein